MFLLKRMQTPIQKTVSQQYCFSSQNSAKTAVFMLNLGGPENVKEITPFLQNLFSDSTVIRIPFGLGKWIGKLRGPAKVQKQYEKIGGGSPIKKWTVVQGKKMIEYAAEKEGNEFLETHGPFYVTPCFRYSNPIYYEEIQNSIEQNPDLEQIVLFSQYPQWSCSTGGNSIREALKIINKLNFPLERVKIIDRWYNNPLYIEAMSKLLYEDICNNFTKEEQEDLLILFSAHSLPVDFVQQGDPYQNEISASVELLMQNLQNKLNQNSETTDKQISYKLAWQSKVGFNSWLKPNTSDALEFYSGHYKNVIVSPLGFTSDHLETLFELDQEYVKDNEDNYEKIHRSRSLNDDPTFISALGTILADSLKDVKKLKYPTSNFGVRCPECVCKGDCLQMNDYLKKNNL